MPKKILQDIVTSNRPARRPIPNSRKGGEIKIKKHNFEDTQNIYNTSENKKTPKFIMWFLAVSSAVFLLFILLSIFSGAVVEVVPVQEKTSLDGKVLDAKKDADSAGNELPFKMIILEDSDSEKVPASEENEVQRKASGNIVIYNKYSSKSQKLIARTRFETPDGKIYRIKKSVVVPGTTVQNGEIIPGSVEVTVYADIPGEEYNIGLVDFTIPGFKGDPRFDKFYARSKTPMEGGFSGIIKSASSEDVKNALRGIENSLKETLLTQARSQVPDDFILYDNAVFFEFSDTTKQKETTGNSVLVTNTGKLYGVIFNKSELSRFIANNFIDFYDNEDVTVLNLDELKLKIIDKEKLNPEDINKLKLEFSGVADVVWNIDKDTLSKSIAGKNKEDFNSIISKYPSVDKAKATIRPFWEKAFPKDIRDITVKIISQEGSLGE